MWQLCERPLRECNLTLPKAISAGHAAEETHKHVLPEILTSQPTADIDKTFKKKHNTRNLNTRDCIKNVNYTIVHISETNSQLMEKFVMFGIKRTIEKFAAYVLVEGLVVV